MASMAATVSVALAVRNGERFILQQLESLAAQTRLPDELVVSDNCSSDETVDIVCKFASRAPFRVHVLTNGCDRGVTKNFECAIERCSGDIIFMSDCDDVWYPKKIAVIEKGFEASHRVGVVVCDADLVDERLRPLGRTLWQDYGFQATRREELAEGRYFSGAVPFLGCCMAFRADFKSLVLPLPDGAVFRRMGHDFFIGRSIVGAGFGGVRLIDTPLLAYRQHSQQMTRALKAGSLPLRWKLLRQRNSDMLMPLLERVGGDAAAQPSANAELREAVLRHWRARVFLPKRRLGRVPVVVRELMAGRYHSYSSGFRSALKDLLFVE